MERVGPSSGSSNTCSSGRFTACQIDQRVASVCVARSTYPCAVRFSYPTLTRRLLPLVSDALEPIVSLQQNEQSFAEGRSNSWPRSGRACFAGRSGRTLATGQAISWVFRSRLMMLDH